MSDTPNQPSHHALSTRYALTGVTILALFWLIGFVIFIHSIEVVSDTHFDQRLRHTDAIVVLTGGSERVGAGLDLLNAGSAQKLFISGVHPGLTLDRLVGGHPVSQELRECCIVLGHAAESTRGNAEETQTWMALENFHSLRLVTSNYHMPRSLMVFRAAMPDVVIVPNAISPDTVKLEGWWRHPGTISLLVTEYNKYLVADFRQRFGF